MKLLAGPHPPRSRRRGTAECLSAPRLGLRDPLGHQARVGTSLQRRPVTTQRPVALPNQPGRCCLHRVLLLLPLGGAQRVHGVGDPVRGEDPAQPVIERPQEVPLGKVHVPGMFDLVRQAVLVGEPVPGHREPDRHRPVVDRHSHRRHLRRAGIPSLGTETQSLRRGEHPEEANPQQSAAHHRGRSLDTAASLPARTGLAPPRSARLARSSCSSGSRSAASPPYATPISTPPPTAPAGCR